MISIFIDYKLTRYQHEIKYTLSFIFQTLGLGYCFIADTGQLNENDILLIYGYTEPTVAELRSIAQRYITVFIQSDPDLFDPKAYNLEKLRRSLKVVKLLSPTPVLSARKFEHPAENIFESEIHAGKINFDLVGNVFFHLSGLEPQIDPTRDSEGFYPEEASQFEPHRETPIVDNLLWLLDSLIKEHTRAKGLYISQKHYWPEAQQMAVTLSHSVDSLQKWDFSSLFLSIGADLYLLFSLRFAQLWHGLVGKFRYLFTNYEIYWNFDDYRQLEAENGFRSTFFIAAEKDEEIAYSLEDADLQEEIQQTLRDGGDVGLLLTHARPSQDAFLTRKQIMLNQLHKERLGISQARHRVNSTLRELHNKLSPAYSQSTARTAQTGYAEGCSLPFQPWLGGLKASFWELPTVFHTGQLQLSRYRYLQLDPAKHLLKRFLQNTLRTRGIFGLDFSLSSYADLPYCHKLYAYVLALVKANRAWVTTARELADWWEKRSRVTIEEGEFEISVYFPEDLDHFSLQVFNDPKIKEIEGAPGRLDGGLIRFSNVKAGSIAVIRLNKET